jgi:hypothetical protein
MIELKIIAKVRVNSHFAYVFNRALDLEYAKKDELLYGQDECVFTVLKKRIGSRNEAFDKCVFNIKLTNGRTEHCSGQWCDGGKSELEQLLKVNLISVTARDIDSLNDCSIFMDYLVAKEELSAMIKDYEEERGYYYDYCDYKKIIMYENKRKKTMEKAIFLGEKE